MDFDLSFLWNWLTPAEWDAAIRACLTGIGVTEALKRGARLAGRNPSAFTLWLTATLVTTGYAALHILRELAGAGPIALPQVLDLFLFATLVGPFAPFAHWLVVLKGADFLSWAIEKRTGYQVNLREVAAGSTYRLKRVKRKDGTEVDVPEDTPPSEYDHTVVTKPRPPEEPR